MLLDFDNLSNTSNRDTNRDTDRAASDYIAIYSPDVDSDNAFKAKYECVGFYCKTANIYFARVNPTLKKLKNTLENDIVLVCFVNRPKGFLFRITEEIWSKIPDLIKHDSLIDLSGFLLSYKSKIECEFVMFLIYVYTYTNKINNSIVEIDISDNNIDNMSFLGNESFFVKHMFTKLKRITNVGNYAADDDFVHLMTKFGVSNIIKFDTYEVNSKIVRQPVLNKKHLFGNPEKGSRLTGKFFSDFNTLQKSDDEVINFVLTFFNDIFDNLENVGRYYDLDNSSFSIVVDDYKPYSPINTIRRIYETEKNKIIQTNDAIEKIQKRLFKKGFPSNIIGCHITELDGNYVAHVNGVLYLGTPNSGVFRRILVFHKNTKNYPQFLICNDCLYLMDQKLHLKT